MARRKTSKTFVADENNILVLAQTAERFGCRPSELLKITDEATALDFDTVCRFRLVLLDLERQKKELAAMRGEEYDPQEQTKQFGNVAGKITKDTLFW